MMRKKSRGPHGSSLDKNIARSVEALERQPCVNRVIIGPAENARHKYPQGFVRYATKENNKVFAACYTGRGIMELIIVCEKGREEEIIEFIDKEHKPISKNSSNNSIKKRKKRKKKSQMFEVPFGAEQSHNPNRYSDPHLTYSLKSQLKDLMNTSYSTQG